MPFTFNAIRNSTQQTVLLSSNIKLFVKSEGEFVMRKSHKIRKQVLNQ